MDCRKEMPIMAQPDCTGVAETPDVCMVVPEIPYICTGVVETPPEHNIVAVNPPLIKKKQNGLMTLSNQYTF